MGSSEQRAPLRLALKLALSAASACLTLTSPFVSVEARPVKRPVTFKLLAEPQLKALTWGIIDQSLTLPLWFALKLEDRLGQPIPHAQLILSCDKQHSAISQSAEDGWVYGALPLSCAGELHELSPRQWRVQVEATERSVARDASSWFVPRLLEGSWYIERLSQSPEHLSYLLRHNLRPPHPLRAHVKIRPCLQTERESGVPATQPDLLLSGLLKQEGISYRTLSKQSPPGLNKLLLNKLQVKVGCYVLSASSPARPWAHLLEARALIKVRGRLKVSISQRVAHTEHLELSGHIKPLSTQAAWDASSLARALSGLSLSASLSTLEPSDDEASSALRRSQAELGPLELLPQVGSTTPKLSVAWRARLPFPSVEAGQEGEAYLASLSLKGGPLHFPEELALSGPVSPLVVGPLSSLWEALHQPDFWLKIFLLWLLLRAASQVYIKWERKPKRREPPPQRKRPLNLRWARSTTLPSDPSPAPLGGAMIELQLLDVEARSTIGAAGEAPLVSISEPEPIFNAQRPPLLRPTHALEAVSLVRDEALKVTRLTLNESHCRALSQGEELWLWVSLEGYEGCVTALREEHLNQRLSMPLWASRAALKRQLSALSGRCKGPSSFGREGLEALRAQLQDPALKRFVFRAEELLYSGNPLHPLESLEVAWGLSDGYLRDALSPHDVRARRSSHAALPPPLSGSVAPLIALLALWIQLALPAPLSAQRPSQRPTSSSLLTLPPDASSLSFKSWIHLISESCNGRPTVLRSVPLSALASVERLILLNPHAIPSELLEWIKQGGRLFVAVEPEGARRSQSFLARLDLSLSPPTLDSTHHRASGIWWSEYALDQGHLLPFIGSSMTHFVEGPSWYQHEIAPAWVDELGRSLGYRVKIGLGSIFLLGDADALSDELMSVTSNQLSALAFIEWLLHGPSERPCPLILTSPAHIEGATSTSGLNREERWSKLIATIREWLSALARWLTQLLGSSYGNQLIATLALGLWLVVLSRRYLRS